MRTTVDDERLISNSLGFLEIRDKPTEVELQSYYEDHYYQEENGNYRQSYSEDELQFIRHKIDQKCYLIQQLGIIGEGRSLLDVGCGEGYTLKRFHEQGYRVEGLDFSLAGVKAMNPDMARFVEPCDVFQALESKIKRGEQYNVIWLQHVLEHVLDPLQLLQSLSALVADAGVMLVTVPNDGNELQETLFRQGFVTRRSWIAPPDHLSYFNVESLKAAVCATGWRCLDVISDFPIDFYLLHPGSNYVDDSEQGPAAHSARIQLELMIAASGHEAANNYFRANAAVGIGRSVTAVVAPAR